MAIVHGSDNPELINHFDGVTNDADTIYGHNGDDDIYGRGGNDIILGGLGADDIDGDNGFDTASYTDSDVGVQVSLLSNAGHFGTAEGDRLESIENLTGSQFDDLLVGDANANVIRGRAGMDILKGGGGEDELHGGTENDILKGGGGADKLRGGAGIDTVAYNESDEGVDVWLATNFAANGDAANDEFFSIENVTGSTYGDDLWGNNDVNVLKGMGGIDVLKGYGGDDTLWGGNAGDELLGMAGEDKLYGENGNDDLDGGTGDDVMKGGYGNDDITVDSQGDTVIEVATGGYDTVWARVNYVLADAADVEVLRAVDIDATTAINLTGNVLNNYMIGNDGENVMDGGAGADGMQGEYGDDIYYVDNMDDYVSETVDAGSDLVRAKSTYILTAGSFVEGLTTVDAAGTNSMTLVGNDHAQTIVGNAGINVLRGFGGSDQIAGREGNDTLTGHAGNDKFLFNTALNAATNVDTVTDMTAGGDIIRLEDAIFTQAGAVGTLDADAFHIGASAADAQDRIVYNSATGDLFYDSNGSAAGGSTLFAKLTTGLALTNADFAIV